MVTRATGCRGTAALVLLLGGCGDPPTFSPDAAGISVSSMTSGDPIESDGYTVTLDGQSSRRLGPNASVLISPIEPGDHTLELSGIDPDCAVNGVNPRTVHSAAGMTAQSIFIVGCSVPGTGRILVQTYTYGDGPDHYRVDLDLGRSAEIGANDQTTFFAVPAGPVILTLSGAPNNCNVASANPRILQLPEGVQLFSQFKIHCFN
jgi:hypothetical protein